MKRYQPTKVNFTTVFYLTFGPLFVLAGALVCWAVERA